MERRGEGGVDEGRGEGGVTGAVSHKGATPREQHIYLFPTLPKKSHRHHPFPTPLMILMPLPLSPPSSLQPAKESPPLRKWELRNEYSLSAKPPPSPPTLHTIVLYTLNFSGLCQVFLTLGIALRCHGVCEGRTLLSMLEITRVGECLGFGCRQAGITIMILNSEQPYNRIMDHQWHRDLVATR